MQQYIDYIDDILTNGELRKNRTGIDTYSVFGRNMEFDLNKGFPALTVKHLVWDAVWAELLWFLSGSDSVKKLSEITHGKGFDNFHTIWTANANAFEGSFDGDVGRAYGVQWRDWEYVDISDTQMDKNGVVTATGILTVHDQISTIIDQLRNNPNDRRILLNAWNVGEVNCHKMALPPCHVMAQFYVNKRNELSCYMYQRSVDSFLGLPFNIASYALLTHILAKICGMGVDRLLWAGGDCHIYTNHVKQSLEMINREPHSPPELKFHGMLDNRYFETIDCFLDEAFALTDVCIAPFELGAYSYHPALKGKMAV